MVRQRPHARAEQSVGEDVVQGGRRHRFAKPDFSHPAMTESSKHHTGSPPPPKGSHLHATLYGGEKPVHVVNSKKKKKKKCPGKMPSCIEGRGRGAPT
eukprot:3256748-Prymnesium_polylepis.3